MKSMFLYPVMVLLICSTMFLACSDNKETESEKGTIETVSDKAANEAIRRIRTPIEKARSVNKLPEKRLNDMDEALKKQ